MNDVSERRFKVCFQHTFSKFHVIFFVIIYNETEIWGATQIPNEADIMLM